MLLVTRGDRQGLGRPRPHRGPEHAAEALRRAGVGAVAGRQAPAAVGSCRLPAPREFPDDASGFRRAAGRTADGGAGPPPPTPAVPPTWSCSPTANPR